LAPFLGEGWYLLDVQAQFRSPASSSRAGSCSRSTCRREVRQVAAGVGHDWEEGPPRRALLIHSRPGGLAMAVARVTEISATSNQSFEGAIREGIDRANKTLRNVRSAWIKEQTVRLEDGAIAEYQVNM